MPRRGRSGSISTPASYPAGSFLLLALAALAVGVVLGLVLERGLLRFVYGRDDILVVLVTYAAFLILENLVLQIWGVEAYPAYQPASLLGTAAIAGLPFDGLRADAGAAGRR